MPPGPAREDAFNPHPSPKSGLEERISVKEAGLQPLPLGHAANGDNLGEKSNRYADNKLNHLSCILMWSTSGLLISISRSDPTPLLILPDVMGPDPNILIVLVFPMGHRETLNT